MVVFLEAMEKTMQGLAMDNPSGPSAQHAGMRKALLVSYRGSIEKGVYCRDKLLQSLAEQSVTFGAAA